MVVLSDDQAEMDEIDAEPLHDPEKHRDNEHQHRERLEHRACGKQDQVDEVATRTPEHLGHLAVP